MMNTRNHPVYRLNRRGFLTGIGAAAVGAALGTRAESAPPQGGFSFVFLTDPHIQPELGAADGVKKALGVVRTLPDKPAFGLVGGDLVMDATQVEPKRAEQVYG